MMGYHITEHGIANSRGEACQEPPYLDWLLDDAPGQPKMMYDLDSGVASLLWLLGISKQDGEKLLKTKSLYLRGTGCKLKYVPSKFLAVDFGGGASGRFAMFADCAGYSDPMFSADTSIGYAMRKAKEAEAVGREVKQAFLNLGLGTGSLVSPIAEFERTYLHDLTFPGKDDLPHEVMVMGYNAIKGNWVEAWEIGAYDHIFDYDINGCYGFELSKLPDWRRGHWTKGEGVNCPKEAAYGFSEGYITCTAAFHPFLMRQGDLWSFTPTGTWRTTLTKGEVDFIQEYGLGEWKPITSWWWTPQGEQRRPFDGVVKYLWGRREKAEGLERAIIKRLLAALWGKTQEVRRTGEEIVVGWLFCPPYASIVEASTRVRVAKTAIDCGACPPIAIAVDGMISHQELPMPLGEELGAWRLSHEGKGIVISSGIAALEGKEGAQEFALSYDWLMSQISHNPQATEYTMRKQSVVSLMRALSTDKWDRLGQVEEITRSIRIGEEEKRMWQYRPRTGGDLLNNRYQSEPWDCSILRFDTLVQELAAEMEEAT